VCCGPAAAGAVYVFVFDKKGRLLIQRRSPNKKIGQGQWDLSVAEHLSQGELTC
jgi:isopentenyldiphosphate isomerase